MMLCDVFSAATIYDIYNLCMIMMIYDSL